MSTEDNAQDSFSFANLKRKFEDEAETRDTKKQKGESDTKVKSSAAPAILRREISQLDKDIGSSFGKNTLGTPVRTTSGQTTTRGQHKRKQAREREIQTDDMQSPAPSAATSAAGPAQSRELEEHAPLIDLGEEEDGAEMDDASDNTSEHPTAEDAETAAVAQSTPITGGKAARNNKRKAKGGATSGELTQGESNGESSTEGGSESESSQEDRKGNKANKRTRGSSAKRRRASGATTPEGECGNALSTAKDKLNESKQTTDAWQADLTKKLNLLIAQMAENKAENKKTTSKIEAGLNKNRKATSDFKKELDGVADIVRDNIEKVLPNIVKTNMEKLTGDLRKELREVKAIAENARDESRSVVRRFADLETQMTDNTASVTERMRATEDKVHLAMKLIEKQGAEQDHLKATMHSAGGGNGDRGEIEENLNRKARNQAENRKMMVIKFVRVTNDYDNRAERLIKDKEATIYALENSMPDIRGVEKSLNTGTLEAAIARCERINIKNPKFDGPNMMMRVYFNTISDCDLIKGFYYARYAKKMDASVKDWRNRASDLRREGKEAPAHYTGDGVLQIEDAMSREEQSIRNSMRDKCRKANEMKRPGEPEFEINGRTLEAMQWDKEKGEPFEQKEPHAIKRKFDELVAAHGRHFSNKRRLYDPDRRFGATGGSNGEEHGDGLRPGHDYLRQEHTPNANTTQVGIARPPGNPAAHPTNMARQQGGSAPQQWAHQGPQQVHAQTHLQASSGFGAMSGNTAAGQYDLPAQLSSIIGLLQAQTQAQSHPQAHAHPPRGNC